MTTHLSIFWLNILLGLPLLLIAIYCFFQGWRMYLGKKSILPWHFLSLQVLRMAGNSRLAEQKRKELLNANFLKNTGRQLIVSGFIIVFIYALFLINRFSN